MAEKIEQMEVEGEAKDKVSSSIWKDYIVVQATQILLTIVIVKCSK